MNIPPLISRTPPPIHDVIDDEDQDEEDDESSFPSINFITPKSPEKSPDNLPAVCVDGFDYKVKSYDIEETNGINILTEAESSDLNTFQPPVFTSQRKKEQPSTIVSSICIDETSHNGKCSSSGTNSVDGNSFDQNINDSICVEPLQNSINSQNHVSDLHEDFSGYQSFNYDEDVSKIKEDPIILKEEDVTPEGEIASPDSDYSCASEKALDEDRCYDLEDENNIKSYLDTNNDDSKVTDVRLVEGQEAIPKSFASEGRFNNECYCVDKCCCAQISDGECESGEQVNDNADSAFDDDSEFGEYKFESALPSETADYIDRDPLSSQFTSELYRVNIAVTKEIDTPPVETNDSNSFPSEEPSEDDAQTVQFNESSKVYQDSSSALTSEPVPAEFSVTFPDVVQNYQLHQPSGDCNDDDEFSDFVECTYEQYPCPVPEKETHRSPEPLQDFSEDLTNQISPILLLCLKEELTKTTVWSKLSSLEHTPALDYKWTNSYSSSRLLSALKIDSRNILSGHWTKLRKLPAEDYRGHNDHIDSYPEMGFNKASVPNPQFEWIGSGLINPLDDVARAKKSNNSMISSEAEKLISSFPDLSFIKQSFIVFPKNID